jgi:hypothetical protein
MPPSNSEKERKPKTEIDEQFLAIARRVMQTRGIKSDRAISLALGRHSDFINRVSKGLQSATPEAWDKLLTDYPEARNITNVTAHGGQAVGTVHGDNVYAPTTLEACQLELEQHKRDLANLRAELEKAQQQVADRDKLIASQEVTIASKEEIITLLRGGYNRPN